MEEEDSEDQFDDKVPPDKRNKLSCIIHKTCHVSHSEVETDQMSNCSGPWA